MSAASFHILAFTLLFSLLNAPLAFSADPNSPVPAPEPAADHPSPPKPNEPSPSPSPSIHSHSPPAPPTDSPAPAPGTNGTSPQKPQTPAPTPGPQAESDVSHADASDEKDDNGGGMSGGQKAGVAVGVIAGVFIVGAGAIVYKKRQSNIQRAQFGYDARREIL